MKQSTRIALGVSIPLGLLVCLLILGLVLFRSSKKALPPHKLPIGKEGYAPDSSSRTSAAPASKPQIPVDEPSSGQQCVSKIQAPRDLSHIVTVTPNAVQRFSDPTNFASSRPPGGVARGHCRRGIRRPKQSSLARLTQSVGQAFRSPWDFEFRPNPAAFPHLQEHGARDVESIVRSSRGGVAEDIDRAGVDADSDGSSVSTKSLDEEEKRAESSGVHQQAMPPTASAQPYPYYIGTADTGGSSVTSPILYTSPHQPSTPSPAPPEGTKSTSPGLATNDHMTPSDTGLEPSEQMDTSVGATSDFTYPAYPYTTPDTAKSHLSSTGLPTPTPSSQTSSPTPQTTPDRISSQHTYSCSECHLSFRTSGQKNSHINRKHKRRYTCPLQACGATFHLNADLKRHKHSVHKDMFGAGMAKEKQWACENEWCLEKTRIWTRKDNFRRHGERCAGRKPGSS